MLDLNLCSVCMGVSGVNEHNFVYRSPKTILLSVRNRMRVDDFFTFPDDIEGPVPLLDLGQSASVIRS